MFHGGLSSISHLVSPQRSEPRSVIDLQHDLLGALCLCGMSATKCRVLQTLVELCSAQCLDRSARRGALPCAGGIMAGSLGLALASVVLAAVACVQFPTTIGEQRIILQSAELVIRLK